MPSSKVVTDQMGRRVEVPEFPMRIISLVPSQTELLYDLGLEDRVVGVTKFCIHPDSWFKTKKIVGGTKKFRFDAIDSLKPDLIIGNKEENYQEGIEVLEKRYPVWMSDISNLADAFSMIERVGELINNLSKAEQIRAEVENGLKASNFSKKGSAIYLIWRNPWIAAGSDSFIHEMMELAGYSNLIQESRYPELTIEEMKASNPQHLLLSSEPFPFGEKHMEELRLALPSTNIRLVDGEIFSWYGSRLLKAADYFNSL